MKILVRRLLSLALLLGFAAPAFAYQSYWSVDPAYKPTFTQSSPIAISGYGPCHARMSDGRILYGGTFDTVSGTALPNAGGQNLALVNDDGSVDTTFPLRLVAGDFVNAVAAQSDGHVVIIGTYHGVSGVVRVNPDGTVASSFGSTDATSSSLAIDSQGRTYISVGYAALARYLPDGTPDHTFSTTIVPDLLELLPNGKMVVVEHFSGIARRLDTSGNVELTYNANAPGLGGLCALPDGSICGNGGSTPGGYTTHYTAAGVMDVTVYGPVPEVGFGLPFDELKALGASSGQVSDTFGRDIYIDTSGRVTGIDNGSPYRLVKNSSTGPSYDASPSYYGEDTSDETLVGYEAVLSFQPYGLAPFTFQWYHAGLPVPNGTSNLLIVTNVQYSDAGSYYAVITNSAGSATTAAFSVYVDGAPEVTVQPTNLSVAVGQPASLAATVVGSPAPTYQWYLNGTAISGATSANLALASAQTTDSGTYTLTAINVYGSATSSPAVLTVYVPNAGPTITIQPSSQTVEATASANFSVSATGPGTVTYQWYLNNQPISGATGSTFTLGSVSRSDVGAYSVVVTSDSVAVTSAQAMLTVLASQLSNLSTRAYVGSGANSLIAGFAVAGSGNKPVLSRAVGPGLAAFGLTGLLASPELSIFDSTGLVIGSDTGWGNVPVPGTSPVHTVLTGATSETFNSVGAFALTAGSADSALSITLPAASTYTVQVSGVDGGTGTAVVELYDEAVSSPTSRMTNLSSRAFVGSGTQNLIAGFAISGPAPERVLIRAVGPGLAQFGLSGALATPQLTLYDSSGAAIATATGWGSVPIGGASSVQSTLAVATQDVFTAVGAFGLTTGSADCAMVVTLPPGSTYTAGVAGLGGTTGIALVEIYEIP